jgi:hypothetical protein
LFQVSDVLTKRLVDGTFWILAQQFADLFDLCAEALAYPDPRACKAIGTARLRSGELGHREVTGRLDDNEQKIMNRHPVIGYELLKPLPYRAASGTTSRSAQS